MKANLQDTSSTETVELEYPPVRTQFLIFTLLGDYIVDRGGKIWTSSLLQLMALLGISERAVRSALSRITQKGWIVSQKIGRRSQYILTDRGLSLMESGHQRIFEAAPIDWDGKWNVVVYSFSEEKRQIRHALRTHLSWLGFGLLTPGTWISPHHPIEKLNRTFKELDIEKYVDMFSGVFLGPSSVENIINRCWDLERLAIQYQKFIEQFKDEYVEIQDMMNNNSQPDPKECFIRRFWLTHSFQSFPLKDPNLPMSILPPSWVGTKAREFFDNYYQLLGVQANRFVDQVIADDGKSNQA